MISIYDGCVLNLPVRNLKKQQDILNFFMVSSIPSASVPEQAVRRCMSLYVSFLELDSPIVSYIFRRPNDRNTLLVLWIHEGDIITHLAIRNL
jgi:hypothetical protein